MAEGTDHDDLALLERARIITGARGARFVAKECSERRQVLLACRRKESVDREPRRGGAVGPARGPAGHASAGAIRRTSAAADRHRTARNQDEEHTGDSLHARLRFRGIWEAKRGT